MVREYLFQTSRVEVARLNGVGLGENVLLDENDPDNHINRRVEVFNMGNEAAATVRGAAGGAHSGGTNAISSASETYCLAEGMTPIFHVAEAPAGENALFRDQDWPPVEEGRYVWSLGLGGTAIFQVVALANNVSDPLTAAGIYLRNDWGAQAKAAFEQVIAESTQQ